MDWLDKQEYPFESRFLDLDGHKLHYIDEGEGPVVLFVHGTPSWSFDFRNQIKGLRSRFRCVALDHLGFGRSDKPEDYPYATIRHADNLQKLVDYLGLQEYSLVLHDFGGPIGFSLALRHPERVRKWIILNSWLWDSREEPSFQRMSRLLRSPALKFLYRYLNFSARFALPASFGSIKLDARIRKQYTAPFARISERNGPIGMVRSLLQDQEWFGSLWRQRERMYGIPLLVIWGMKDPVISTAYLSALKQGFPEAEVLELKNCGHFPQEEEASAVTQALLGFLA
ncbi:MAG TPA: alpha/beta fold hydrolase [Saprospiraceae bacterium]|nr:alpha/beta fold hydrolase [Saprospiraceae bacterium]